MDGWGHKVGSKRSKPAGLRADGSTYPISGFAASGLKSPRAGWSIGCISKAFSSYSLHKFEGMDNGYNLWTQVSFMKQALMEQGYLNEQFYQLETLEDDTTPNFVEDIVKLFFRESAKVIATLETVTNTRPLNFDMLDRHIHRLISSSCSIGAERVLSKCWRLKIFGEEGDTTGLDKIRNSSKQVSSNHLIADMDTPEFETSIHDAANEGESPTDGATNARESTTTGASVYFAVITVNPGHNGLILSTLDDIGTIRPGPVSTGRAIADA
ncbi:Histidine-containing phosphotransfer protein 4 [Acorus gramineus]|uniref:Histidine-containing phosphotransfer protein n=1 Tax=Acorus gramineus TaxID=55184 RepID=A0AAV9A2C0_ACOGR|nr:Histidine-containing phosphotransfer protein 4 [Acorus gramineus]